MLLSLNDLKLKRITHRDFKLSNILLVHNPDNPQYYYYKLGDVGESYFFPENCNLLEFPFLHLTTVLGYTYDYVSPEVQQFFKSNQKKHKAIYNPFASDVFSIGMTTAFLMNLQPEDIREIQQNLPDLLLPPKLQNYENLVPILKETLNQIPELRITLEDLLQYIEKFENCIQAPKEEKFIEQRAEFQQKEIQNADDQFPSLLSDYR